MNRKLSVIISLMMAFGLMYSNSFAEKGHHGSKQMRMSDKFFMKVKMIYKNQVEIGVTDDQMGKIKSLKLTLTYTCLMLWVWQLHSKVTIYVQSTIKDFSSLTTV